MSPRSPTAPCVRRSKSGETRAATTGAAQLTGEFARTTKRRDDAQAKSASLQAAVDEALFDGRQPDQLEKQHDAATRELKAAEYRLQRLSVLIPEAKRAALGELRSALAAERQKQAARLSADVAKASEDLAAAAESLVGALFVKTAAHFRLSHGHDANRYAEEAEAAT